MTDMTIIVDCKRCQGMGEIMVREKLIDSDGSEDIGATPHPEGCPKCYGSGQERVTIKRSTFLDQCPHCGEHFAIDRIFEKVKKSLLGRTQDLTHWLDGHGVITIDAMNTRFVEKTLKDGPRIELYNTFLEHDRLGNYHGYWKKKQVESIVHYLKEWLAKHG